MLYQGLYHHIESVGVPHLFLATEHCVSCVMGLQDGKTFKPTICVEFSRASLYAIFLLQYLLESFCCVGLLLGIQVSSIWCPFLGCPTGLGVPLLGHRMFPLWRILCRLRHFVAKRDVFMAANPSAASPRNFGDTVGRTQL